MSTKINLARIGATIAIGLICLTGNAQSPSIHNFEVAKGQVTFDAVFPNQTGANTNVSTPPGDNTNATPGENTNPTPGDNTNTTPGDNTNSTPGDNTNPTPGTTPATAQLPRDDFFLWAHHGNTISMSSSPNPTKDTLKVFSRIPHGVFPGERTFKILYQTDTVASITFKVPNPLSGVSEQPIIESISPQGTAPGRMVTIRGRGFGDNLDDIYIWFTSNRDNDLPTSLAHVINPTDPTYLTSPDVNGVQELKFILPGEDRVDGDDPSFKQSWLEYELRMRVVVKGQPSANSEILSIVTNNYRTILLLLVLGIFTGIVGGIWALSIYLKRRGFKGGPSLRYLVIDQTTNRLSLAKCQALAWTIVLVISYSYYVLMTYMILDKSVIPDFDASLLVLMGITTSGLLIARSQDKTKQNKAAEAGKLDVAKNPSLWDLVMEGGSINLASLQLVMFTIVGIGIYIVYMTSPNLVETGLPTMPDTLLALMGISQGGYVTGKAVEGSGDSATEKDSSGNTNSTEAKEKSEEAKKPAVSENPGQPGEQEQAKKPQNPEEPKDPS